MDVAKQKNCHYKEDDGDCPDDDDPEPDSYKLIQVNEHRKGRFIIEELEEQNNEDNVGDYLDRRIDKSLFSSFRKSKYDFSCKQIEGEYFTDINNLNNLHMNNLILNQSPVDLIFDFESNTFVNMCDVFQNKRIDSAKSIFKYSDMFIQDVQVSNFPDDIPDHDYALIIQEETLENEIDIESSIHKNENLIEIIELKQTGDSISGDNINKNSENNQNSLETNNKYSRNKKDIMSDKPYKSLEVNFTNLNNQKFVSPSCSPIQSPKESSKNLASLINPSQPLYATSSYKISKNKKKMIRNFIRSIEDSFNLEDKKDLEDNLNSRKKRLYSADKTYENKFNKNEKIQSNKVINNNFEIKGNYLSQKSVYCDLSIEHTISFCCSNTTDASFTKNTSFICKNCTNKKVIIENDK